MEERSAVRREFDRSRDRAIALGPAKSRAPRSRGRGWRSVRLATRASRPGPKHDAKANPAPSASCGARRREPGFGWCREIAKGNATAREPRHLRTAAHALTERRPLSLALYLGGPSGRQTRPSAESRTTDAPKMVGTGTHGGEIDQVQTPCWCKELSKSRSRIDPLRARRRPCGPQAALWSRRI